MTMVWSMSRLSWLMGSLNLFTTMRGKSTAASLVLLSYKALFSLFDSPSILTMHLVMKTTGKLLISGTPYRIGEAYLITLVYIDFKRHCWKFVSLV